MSRSGCQGQSWTLQRHNKEETTWPKLFKSKLWLHDFLMWLIWPSGTCGMSGSRLICTIYLFSDYTVSPMNKFKCFTIFRNLSDREKERSSESDPLDGQVNTLSLNLSSDWLTQYNSLFWLVNTLKYCLLMVRHLNTVFWLVNANISSHLLVG